MKNLKLPILIAIFAWCIYLAVKPKPPEIKSATSTELKNPAEVNPTTGYHIAATNRLAALKHDVSESRRNRPDKRFLLAIQAVPQLTSPSKPTDIELAPKENNAWSISQKPYKNQAILSSTPDFPELFKAVQGFASEAATIIKLSATDQAAPDPLTRPTNCAAKEYLATLSAIDSRWQAGGLDADSVVLASQVLTDLLMFNVDEFGLADELTARALAVTALAEAIKPGSCTEQKCLIARLMGYDTDSYKLAEALPADSPVRLYCRKEATDWSSVSVPRDRYLGLLQFAEDVNGSDFSSLLKSMNAKDAEFAIFSALYRLNQFGSRRVSPRILYREAAKFGGTPANQSTLSGIFLNDPNSFDMKISAIEPGLNVDTDGDSSRIKPDRLRGLMSSAACASAVYGETKSAGESLGDVPGTAEFLKTLGQGQTPPGKELAQWADSYIKNQNGSLTLTDLCTLVAGQTHLTPNAYNYQLYTKISGNSQQQNPEVRVVVQKLRSTIDQRPANRYVLNLLSTHFLFDPVYAARQMMADSKETASLPLDRQMEVALFRNDEPLLIELMANPATSAQSCADLMEALTDRPDADMTSIRAMFETLIKRFPRQSSVVNTYGSYLLDHDLNAEAEVVYKAFAEAGPDHETGLIRFHAYNNVALCQLRQNKIQEGMRTLEPILDKGIGTTWRYYSILLDLNGEPDEAMNWQARPMSVIPIPSPAAWGWWGICGILRSMKKRQRC